MSNKKWLAYRLLRYGQSCPAVAGKLKLARRTVRDHAAALVKQGALQIVAGTTSPKLYERGPKSSLFERLNETAESLHGVWSATAALPGCRVHRAAWAIKIEPQPPAKEPEWEKEWRASGTAMAIGSFIIDGHAISVRRSAGPGRASLTFSPLPEVVDGPREVEAVEQRWQRLCKRAAEQFRARYGYGLLGGLEAKQPVEYGFDAPGAPKVGRVGESRAWTDGSPPGRHPEAESQDRDWAVAMSRLPEHQQEQDVRLQRAEAALEATDERLDRMAGLFERLTATMQRQTDLQAQSLETHLASLSGGQETQEVAVASDDFQGVA